MPPSAACVWQLHGGRHNKIGKKKEKGVAFYGVVFGSSSAISSMGLDAGVVAIV